METYQSKRKVAVACSVLRLGEGCLTNVQFSQKNFMAAFAKPLLPAGRFISRNFKQIKNETQKN